MNFKKKHISMVVNKSKESDEKFTTILALEVIKILVDHFLSGEGWAKIMDDKALKQLEKEKVKCNLCDKHFATDRNLRTHKNKYHVNSSEKDDKCNNCESQAESTER